MYLISRSTVMYISLQVHVKMYGGQEWTALCLVCALQQHTGQVVLDNFTVFSKYFCPQYKLALRENLTEPSLSTRQLASQFIFPFS